MSKPAKNGQPSPGRSKLAGLGLQLPPLPTTTVGSLPKQPDLLELRYKVAKGVQNKQELERKERLSTEIWIREQERTGLDILVDGEMHRSDLVNFFATSIGGFAPGGIVRSYGNRYYRKPIIKSKLEWKGPITVEMWRFAQRLTHRPVKAILTGPYTIMDWSFDEHYPSREAALADLTAIIRREVVALAEAGAKLIQIDEPALSSKPKEFPLIQSSLKEITAGLRCYFILHHCYGDVTPLWEKMQQLPVDNFHLEMTNSAFSLLPLMKKLPTTKDLCVGIIESHSHLIDTPREVHQRINSVIDFVAPGQLWFSPDCGLKTRTTEETIGKLRVLVAAVGKTRATLQGKKTSRISK